MSHNKMLIDATHPEETRVVVLKDGRVEEFDYESAARKLLRGSIYLAKVTRVEPSLQAAFVDYSGNRHGFLAFNEIHPDYYQIPYADRQALIDEDLRAEAEEEAEATERSSERSGERSSSGGERGAERGRSRRRGRPERGRGRRRDQRNGRDAGNEGGGDAAVDPLDLEANALDVTDLLPPEPASDVAGGDVAGSASANSPDETTKPASVRAAEAAARAAAGDEPPRTMPERVAGEADVVRSPEQVQAVAGRDADREGVRDAAPHYPDEPRPIGLVEDLGVEQVNGHAADDEDAVEEEQVEVVGAEDVEEEMPSRPRRRMRSYKIQEVIKRRQVVLVQVVKEERGTKGAALTTYLSLAGRYTVLMPNTGRGGGISRKITSGMDRKRLKEIADELEVPEGMGLIIRTAGAARTKQEIKRDFEYLLRLWESVRELTLRSTAPCLVYEEGDLIKRSIRDLYSKDIDEIIVAGDAAHAEASDFMAMLMPSHVKNVVKYTSAEPLFSKFRIEQQLNAMFSPYVHLKSGGYLVINQTEALVSIDINSGKSTREFSIEETALATNLEASDEIARQLRLRDLAGLIVIDFIDMEENRNNRAVERRVKDALRFDRARIQVGRISHFGLLEMSRQRLRTGVLEGSTSQCPHCQGTGIIRSTESVALAVLRGLEDALKVGNPGRLIASTTAPVALYLLNQKRQFIVEMEDRTGISIEIVASEKMHGANFTVDRQARGPGVGRPIAPRGVVNMESGFSGEDEADADEIDLPVANELAEAGEADGQREGEGRSRRRRRRGRGRGERSEHVGTNGNGGHGESVAGHAGGNGNGNGALRTIPVVGNGEDRADDTAEADDERDDDTAPVQAGEVDGGADGDAESGRRRRRGRRGGRRNREGAPLSGVAAPDAPQPYLDDEASPRPASNANAPADAGIDAPAKGRDADAREQRRPPARDVDGERQPLPDAASPAGTAGGTTPARREREPRRAEPRQPAPDPRQPEASLPQPDAKAPEPTPRAPRAEPVHSEPVLQRVVVNTTQPAADDEAKQAPSEAAEAPSRKGWWQRRLGI